METPAPNPSDSEDVATALETAAIFAAKGDGSEAAHWLRRAAECASQNGDDSRASELARALSELAEPERRLPTPPPLRASVRPPPPSERGQKRAPNDSHPMLLVRPATTPAGTCSRCC